MLSRVLVLSGQEREKFWILLRTWSSEEESKLLTALNDAAQDQKDDTEVEGVAQRDQNGLEGPLDEFTNGVDEVLQIHNHALLIRK